MIAFGASNNTDDKKISKLYINIFQKHTGLYEPSKQSLTLTICQHKVTLTQVL